MHNPCYYLSKIGQAPCFGSPVQKKELRGTSYLRYVHEPDSRADTASLY